MSQNKEEQFFKRTEVRKHNTPDSLWVIYEEKVS